MCVYFHGMIGYGEYPKEPDKKLFIVLIVEFSKCFGYKVNMKIELHFYVLPTMLIYM